MQWTSAPSSVPSSPRVLAVVSQRPWLNQLIPNYSISALGSSSFGFISANSVSLGLVIELEFQRIQHNDEPL